MEQIYKNEEVLVLDRPEEAIKEFEELKNKEIKRADEFTIIRMKLIVGCGCGGNSESIFAVVKGNRTDLQEKFQGNYVDKEDIIRMQSRNPGMTFYKGNPSSGVTDSFNPQNYKKIL